MGNNGNRILMAILTGVVLVWSVRFLLMDGHILFHEQKAGVDYPIIGDPDAGGPVVVAEAPAPICEMLADADVGIGETIAKANCTACHQFENEVHGQGPHLVGLIGRQYAGTDFGNYSSALRALDKQWDQEGLNNFLYKPSDYVPGTAMNFAGWDNTKTRQRANVIAYLYSVSGAALPDCPVAEDGGDAGEDMAEDIAVDETAGS